MNRTPLPSSYRTLIAKLLVPPVMVPIVLAIVLGCVGYFLNAQAPPS